MEKAPIVVAMLGDSVCLLPGGQGYIEQLIATVGQRTGRAMQVLSFASPGRCVQDSAFLVDAIAAAQPDVVVFAHGGGDSMRQLRPSLQLRKRLRSTSAPAAPAVSAAGVFAAPPRWEVLLVRAATAVPGLVVPKVAPNEYARLAHAIFERLVATPSVRKLYLLEPLDGDARRMPHDGQALAASARVAADFAARHPHAARYVLTRRHVEHWEDFAHDRAHLRGRGHRRLAAALSDDIADDIAAAVGASLLSVR